jgi:hypothetical protein
MELNLRTWRELYSAAILETDPNQLGARVEEATAALFERDEELDHSAEAEAEREEMAAASEALLVLKNDYQSWQDRANN